MRGVGITNGLRKLEKRGPPYFNISRLMDEEEKKPSLSVYVNLSSSKINLFKNI